MIMPGVDCPPEERPTPEEAARRTLEVLRRRVPPAVPGIVFLSGICMFCVLYIYGDGLVVVVAVLVSKNQSHLFVACDSFSISFLHPFLSL